MWGLFFTGVGHCRRCVVTTVHVLWRRLGSCNRGASSVKLQHWSATATWSPHRSGRDNMLCTNGSINYTFYILSRSGYSCAFLKESPTPVSLFWRRILQHYFSIAFSTGSSVVSICYFTIEQSPAFTCPSELPDGFYTLNNQCTNDYYMCYDGNMISHQVRTKEWNNVYKSISDVFCKFVLFLLAMPRIICFWSSKSDMCWTRTLLW